VHRHGGGHSYECPACGKPLTLGATCETFNYSTLMKVLIFLLLITTHAKSLAQQIINKEDSCITSIKSVRFNEMENGDIKISKDRVPDLIKYIKNCSLIYKYPESYQDHSFELVVPQFLKKISYGYGDNNFYYSFNDSNNDDSLTTSIVIYYDFNDELKNFYNSQIKKGSQKINIIKKDGVDMYKTDYDPEKFEGKLVMNNSIIIMYYTKDEKKEDQLIKCLLSFRFK